MSPEPADLLVTRARPWTDGAPLADADAVATRGGAILAVGRARDVESLAGPRTRRIDAGGATVTPGLTDAHLHLLSWARARLEVDLGGATDRAEAVARVKRHLHEHPGGGPVVGRGWASDRWSEPPDRRALDGLAPERPVLLHSHDFHALWVNSAALRNAGVTRDTPDPPGGRIVRDAAGEPTGLLQERAVRALAALEPSASAEATLALARDSARALHALGVTAVHDFQQEPGALETLRALATGASDPGAPRLRVLKHLPHSGLDAALAARTVSGTGDDWFRIGAVKLFADGTLGSRTASMLEPFDGTSERGLPQMPDAELEAIVARAIAGGLSVAIHAIGDRAVRAALDAYAASAAALPGLALAPRIEHAQLVHPDDLGRFAALGVAASMQPIHCTSDFELAERWWGSRRRHSYPWRSLLASGARLAFGSDAPVEPPDGAAGLHAAVTRRRADGTPPGGFVPEQRLTLDEALAAYTEGPARLAGQWPRQGRLAPGALADLVVWSHDLHGLEPDELARATARVTVLDGCSVHDAGASAGPEASPVVALGRLGS